MPRGSQQGDSSDAGSSASRRTAKSAGSTRHGGRITRPERVERVTSDPIVSEPDDDPVAAAAAAAPAGEWEEGGVFAPSRRSMHGRHQSEQQQEQYHRQRHHQRSHDPFERSQRRSSSGDGGGRFGPQRSHAYGFDPFGSGGLFGSVGSCMMMGDGFGGGFGFSGGGGFGFGGGIFQEMDRMMGRMSRMHEAAFGGAGMMRPGLLTDGGAASFGGGGHGHSSSYSFSSSTYSAVGPDCQPIFRESVSERKVLNGVTESAERYSDSFGNERLAMSRGLGRQSRQLVSEKTYRGESTNTESLTGLQPEEVQSFDSAWEAAREQVDPQRRMLGRPPAFLSARCRSRALPSAHAHTRSEFNSPLGRTGGGGGGSRREWGRSVDLSQSETAAARPAGTAASNRLRLMT